MNPGWFTVRLHAAGEVDGVAPEIVGELMPTDHSGNHGPGVDANPHFKGKVSALHHATKRFEHPECHCRNGLRMVVASHGYAGNRHVGIADRLNFLDAVNAR